MFRARVHGTVGRRHFRRNIKKRANYKHLNLQLTSMHEEIVIDGGVLGDPLRDERAEMQMSDSQSFGHLTSRL